MALSAASWAQELEVAVWSYDVPGEKEYYETLKRDYEAANPGAHVNIVLDKWDDAHDRIRGWIKTASGPDAIVLPDIWIVEFFKGIEPFEKYLKPGQEAEFFPVLFKKGIHHGHLVGLLWATSTKALFYRKDLFDAARIKAPVTWDDQFVAAIKVSDPPKIYGLGLPGKPVAETEDNLYFYFWSAGGRFFGPDGRCAINSEAGFRSLQLYCNYVNKYHLTQPEVTSYSRKEARVLFEQGRLGMYAEGPWLIEIMRKTAPHVPFAVAPLPRDKEMVTQLITDHMVILRGSKQKEAAAGFIHFCYQDKYRLAFAKLGIIPEKIAVAKDDHFQKDPEWKAFVDVIPNGKVIPLINWEEIACVLRDMMVQTLSARKEVRTALDDAARQIDAIVERNGEREVLMIR
jgi:multiple sugar transport system substrate-binding protein